MEGEATQDPRRQEMFIIVLMEEAACGEDVEVFSLVSDTEPEAWDEALHRLNAQERGKWSNNDGYLVNIRGDMAWVKEVPSR